MKQSALLFYHRIFALLVGCIVFSLPLTAQYEQQEPPRVADSSFTRVGFGVTYHHFLDEEMQDVYGSMYGIHIERIAWDWDDMGWRVSGGVMGKEGTPIIFPTTWGINIADIGFWALHGEVSGLYRVTAGNPFRDVTCFFGAGIDLFGATEKLTVNMQKGDSVLAGDASALRGSVGAHGLLGITIPTGKRNSIVLEAKFLFAPAFGYSDLLSGDQKDLFQNQIYTILQRPNFNLTGASFSFIILM